MVKKKTDGKPLITVVMITYNGVRYIDDAVQSLLAQTDLDFEVVIVNDASTDETPRKIDEAKRAFEKKGVRCRTFVNKQNRGTGYSWGRASQLAETPWVLFLADDDRYMSKRIERTRAFIAAHPDAPWFYHDAIILKEATGEKNLLRLPQFNTGKESMQHFFELALKNIFMVHNSVAIKKEVYKQSGGFRDLRGVEDFDFWMRLIEQGFLPEKMEGEPLLTYRSRGLDVSRFPYQSYYGAFVQVMNDFLDRNRGKNVGAVLLAREFRIGVYIAYIMRSLRRGNIVLALKALGGMVQRDFSILQFARMMVVKFFRIFKGEN
ncbi:MAG: glycosyltransferase [Candidatus Burarchaeum sp.]|nr:glycosyltransferase [Candidatus Burarchaeum sp.]MDO8339043.1 glycosyltransferase [Candidatus Burarchaeum sp.]